ncbi:MAG: ABC transporter permease [Lachnospiraceae bacterium]
MSRFKRDIKKFWEYGIYSGKSMLKSEIADSHLSWLWWILDPLLFMLVYSFLAMIVFQTREKYFSAFIFVGLSVWTFFSKTLKQSVRLVTRNSAIVSKVYIPKYILIFIQIFVNGFKMGVSLLLVVGMMLIYRVPITINILYIIPLFIVLFLVTFGISTFFLHFGVFVDDLYNVINVLLRLVFYMSGIFFSVEKRVPAPFNAILLKCNPAAYIIDSLRKCMLYSTTPDIWVMIIWFVIGIVLSVIGIRIIYKYENSYVKVI